MSTAHRPTWAPAKGHLEQGGNRLYFASKFSSAKNQLSYSKLKRRQSGQGFDNELGLLEIDRNLHEREDEHSMRKKARVNGDFTQNVHLHQYNYISYNISKKCLLLIITNEFSKIFK